MVRTSRSCQTDPLHKIQPLKRLRPTPKPSRASSSAPPLPPPPPPGIVGVWHPSMAAASGLAPAAAKYPETPAARPISPTATPVTWSHAGSASPRLPRNLRPRAPRQNQCPAISDDPQRTMASPAALAFFLWKGHMCSACVLYVTCHVYVGRCTQVGLRNVSQCLVFTSKEGAGSATKIADESADYPEVPRTSVS